MEQESRAQRHILGSVQGVVAFASVISLIAAIDVVTRAVDPFTKAKLAAWLVSTFVMTLRIARVLRKIHDGPGERSDAEKLLFQIAMLMPIAGIIPLAFL